MARSRKKHRPEEIVAKLRDADAMLNTGKDLAGVFQVLEASESTFERPRAQYGGMKCEEAKRLKHLWDGNRRLKQLVADQAMEIFDGVPHARSLVAFWRDEYNTQRPHSSLGYLPPAGFAAACAAFTSAPPAHAGCLGHPCPSPARSGLLRRLENSPHAITMRCKTHPAPKVLVFCWDVGRHPALCEVHLYSAEIMKPSSPTGTKCAQAVPRPRPSQGPLACRPPDFE